MSPKVRGLPVFPALMIVVGAALVLGSILWTVRQPSNNIVEVSPTAPALRIPYPDVPRVSAVEAKAAFDAQSAIFIDTRGEPYYSQGHIPGALSITEDEVLSRLDEFDPSGWIVTYCTWPAEESSAGAAQILLEAGFSHVTAIKGGLDAWAQAGYPVER